MIVNNLIILLSILYSTSGRVTGKTQLNATVPAEITNATSESPPPTNRLPDESRDLTKWYCADGGYINKEKKCDGEFDCRDVSDEYLETCRKEKPRPLFGLILYCSSFWSSYHVFVCPDICQKSPEFCYYAIMAENHEKDTCVLPDYPINGTYIIMPTNKTDIPGRVNFWLKYSCEEPYVMVQKELLQCINGEWSSDPKENGYCSEACALNKNSNFTYQCPVDVYGTTDCGDYVAIRTAVNVSRATQEKNNQTANVSVEILCSEDHEFHISTDCVNEVDKMQQGFENSTMIKMASYETSFTQLKSNQSTPEFDNLVKEYHKFEKEVRGNMTLMHTTADKCDISLDLLLYNLQENKKKKEENSISK